MRFAAPEIRWRCTLCGLCCQTYIPVVLPSDVERIQEAHKRPLSAFLAFYGPHEFDAPLPDPYQGFAFVTRDGPKLMCLSRQDLPSGSAGCVFLKNNLCTIHLSRPYVCRQYPFRPVDYGRPEGPFRLMDDPCFGNHASDEAVDMTRVRQNYSRFMAAEEEYLRTVREWNGAPEAATRGIEDFLSSLGLAWS